MSSFSKLFSGIQRDIRGAFDTGRQQTPTASRQPTGLDGTVQDRVGALPPIPGSEVDPRVREQALGAIRQMMQTGALKLQGGENVQFVRAGRGKPSRADRAKVPEELKRVGDFALLQRTGAGDAGSVDFVVDPESGQTGVIPSFGPAKNQFVPLTAMFNRALGSEQDLSELIRFLNTDRVNAVLNQ